MRPTIRGSIKAGRSINVADEITIINVEHGAQGEEPAASDQDVNIATHRVVTTTKDRRTPAEILADLLGL